jgi:MscS family membrane protein
MVVHSVAQAQPRGQSGAVGDRTVAGASVIERNIVPHLHPALREQVFGIYVWQYLALLLLVAVAVLARTVIRMIVKGRVKHLVDHLGQKWAAKLVDVFASPGATLLMAGMLRVAYPALRLPPDVSAGLGFVVRALVVISLVWAAYRAVDVVAERMSARAAATESKLDDQLIPLVRRMMKFFIILAGSLVVVQNLGVDVGSLLAGLGIGGVAVALAAKDTIANFFGSLTIFVDQPFQIGDNVVVAGVEGTVVDVGFRSTRIRTGYDSLVTIPNAKFSEANIDNLGRRTYRRTAVILNLTHDTTAEQLEAFCEGVRGVVLANRCTRKEGYEVHFCGFGAHSLDVSLVFFVQVESLSRELQERHNVLLEVLRLAEALGVRFAFPTQTLHVESLASAGATRPLHPAPSQEQLARVVRAFAPSGSHSRPVPPTFAEGAHLPAR